MYRLLGQLPEIRRLLRLAKRRELSAATVSRLKWFIFAIEHGGNVSLTCRHFCIARSTFMRWVSRFDVKDMSSLEDESRRPRNVRKPQTQHHVIEWIRELREQHPTMKKEAIAEHLSGEHGVEISASTVGRIIRRHKFFFADTASHRSKRGLVEEVCDALLSPPLTPDIGFDSPASCA